MVITREKATIHVFEGFQFVPGVNVVPDKVGRKIINLKRFQEQVKLGYMKITEPPADKEEEDETPEDLVSLLRTKNARDAKNLVKEVLDIKALRAVLDSEEEDRSTVIAAVEDQIAKLEEGRSGDDGDEE